MNNSDFEGSCGESQRLRPIEPNFNNHVRQLSTRSYMSDATVGSDRNVVQKIVQKNADFQPMKYYFRLPNYDFGASNWLIIMLQYALLIALVIVVVLC